MNLDEAKKIFKEHENNSRKFWDPNSKYQEACKVIMKEEGYRI